jgi:hypothetical protein
MRTFIKLGAVSLVALVVACGSATPDAEIGAAGVDSPGAQDVPGAGAAGETADEAGKINALVRAAGFLTTDKKADAAPVETSKPETLQVPGEGGTTYQCKYTNYSLTKVPEKFVALRGPSSWARKTRGDRGGCIALHP